MREDEKEYRKEMWWVEYVKHLFFLGVICFIAFYGFENYNFGIKLGVIILLFILMDIRNYLDRSTKEIVELNEEFVKLKDGVEKHIRQMEYYRGKDG